MSVISNVYAEKVYAEHPVAMWLLDDPADYVSIIGNTQRNVHTSWSKTNIASSSNTTVTNIESPFPNSSTTQLIIDDETQSAKISSPTLAAFSDLNFDLRTFNFSTYIYSDIPSSALNSIVLGYSYESTPGTWVDVTAEEEIYTNFPIQSWTLISKTFNIPLSFLNNNFRVYIKANVNNTGLPSSYIFYVNGVTVGQWSEEFNAVSLGVETTTLPSDINLEPKQVTKAYAYSVDTTQDVGYYFSNRKFFTAQNTGIPIVYGASNVTSITNNRDSLNITMPSLIVPGKGFLNKIGQYQDYTIEFWARINCDAINPRKIFGPIKSNDGIYVEDGFITLSIGGVSGSHFVGKWFRPMLIHICLTRDSATLLLNGEEVIELNIVTKDLILPDQYATVGGVQKSQDWLGFYGYSDVYPFEIDCISIYSYQIPTIVAKRRYVYGQAVGSPENINTAFGGTTAFVDYSFSNYSVNYNYPDFAKWEQASIENLTASKKYLSTPDYSLPTVYLGDNSIDDFYKYNQLIATNTGTYKFIKLMPPAPAGETNPIDWSTIKPYINFPKFNFLTSSVVGFYGVFKITESHASTGDQIIFKLNNKITGDSLTVKKDRHTIGGVEKDVIAYYLNFGGIQYPDIIVKEYTLNQLVAVGIDIDKFSKYYGGNIASFFGNSNGLELFVGGDGAGNESFSGEIYDIGFCTQRNLSELSNHFDTDGLAFTKSITNGSTTVNHPQELLDHLASYTLLIQENYGVFNFDIGVSGYWQDYLPLSYFAKFVKDQNDKSYYDLDLLQLNLGYPSSSSLLETITSDPWDYKDIPANTTNYSTYGQLYTYTINNSLNYSEFSQNITTSYSFNTNNASVKSYVTFQYIENGANLIPSSFTQLTAADQSRLLDISKYSDWQTRKFEFVDNTIIYPRKDVDFNDIAVVISLEFNVKGIINKKISIDSLQVASLAFNDNGFNPIGTRFGVNLYPYKKDDLYYTYKDKNPFSIYKGSTPYLYLTRDSGIEIRGEIEPLEDRGITMFMNEKSADLYSVNAFQMWMRFDQDQFPSGVTELFEIVGKSKTIKFFMEPVDILRKRARIFATTNSGAQNFIDISYFINGKPVLIPTITTKQWSSLGFSLDQSLDLNKFTGRINIVAPLVFNNISYFKTNNLSNIETVVTRQWSAVKSIPLAEVPPEGWNYWLPFTWRNVYGTFSSTELGVSPSSIYAAYIGTNKLVVDDNLGLSLTYDKMATHSDVSWNRIYQIPV